MNPMATHGAFSWFAYQGKETEKALSFYREVLDWKTFSKEMDDGSQYEMILVEDEPAGGFSPSKDEPSGWLVYITVDNVDRRIEKASEAGAEILVAPYNVPGVGRIAVLQDPFGTLTGFVTYESMQS